MSPPQATGDAHSVNNPSFALMSPPQATGDAHSVNNPSFAFMSPPQASFLLVAMLWTPSFLRLSLRRKQRSRLSTNRSARKALKRLLLHLQMRGRMWNRQDVCLHTVLNVTQHAGATLPEFSLRETTNNSFNPWSKKKKTPTASRPWEFIRNL